MRICLLRFQSLDRFLLLGLLLLGFERIRYESLEFHTNLLELLDLSLGVCVLEPYLDVSVRSVRHVVKVRNVLTLPDNNSQLELLGWWFRYVDTRVPVCLSKLL